MRRRLLLIGLFGFSVSGCATRIPASLDVQSQDEIARIEHYLNDMHSMRAQFLQVGNDGVVTPGVAWLERPGRLRLDYDPPSQTVLIAANGHVVLHDGASDATTRMPLARTPLAMLLAPDITLSGPVTVSSFQHLPNALRATMVRTANPGQGSLTLTFQDNPLVLREVQMVDARGDTTRLVLTKLETGIVPPANLFQLGTRPTA
jgi:outer membrane lipoprotein-sorting protein